MRAYLARKLNCAPMRISKKFAGRCIGKLVFSRKSSMNLGASNMNESHLPNTNSNGNIKSKLSHLEEVSN